MSIYFSSITPDNWRAFNALKVKKEQEKFVLENVGILAKTYAYRDYNSRVHAIFYGDVPIGILMQHDYIKNDKLCCLLDQFMIAEQYQGNGYGKAVIKLWLSMIKNEEKYDSIILCYKEDDDIACNLYLDMGFYHTGESDEDEIIMEYDLRSKV